MNRPAKDPLSPLPPGVRIIEGVMTTLAPPTTDATAGAPPEQRVNVAPMGPMVIPPGDRLILRPFVTSTTYRNLKATGQGVFHITDDVLLIARGALRRIQPDELRLTPAAVVEGLVIADACRYHELRVDTIEDDQPRTRIEARVVHSERLRDWDGFNRAQAAVIEAAILATRLHLTGADPVREAIERLREPVFKTGAEPEREALAEIEAWVHAWRPDPAAPPDIE